MCCILEAAGPAVASLGCPYKPDPRFDAMESEMAKHEQVRLPLNHLFTPGLYIREAFLPAGTRCTSKIHLTEHPFVISMGRVLVWSGIEGEDPQEFGAPYTGITKPGTRRVIHALEDTVWSTFHPTSETDVEKIEDEIIFKHDEHLPFSVTAFGEQTEKREQIEDHANT